MMRMRLRRGGVARFLVERGSVWRIHGSRRGGYQKRINLKTAFCFNATVMEIDTDSILGRPVS